jgi:glycine/D-amino acid oxidase-like deaminating enzyme
LVLVLPRQARWQERCAAGEVRNRLADVAARRWHGELPTQERSKDTGQRLDWVHSGSLKIARRPQDAEVIASDVARGRRLGLDAEQISPEEAYRLNPFLQPEGVQAALRVGDDLYFDPAQVAVGFARAAEANGALLMPQTTVTCVKIDAGKVTGVETDQGPIRAPIVVDAAGAWTRQVAEVSVVRGAAEERRCMAVPSFLRGGVIEQELHLDGIGPTPHRPGCWLTGRACIWPLLAQGDG